MKVLKSQKAFTLVELVIVVSIVILLMSIIIPSSQKVLSNARKSKAQSAMKQIAEAYCRYYQDNGYIPVVDSSVELAKKFAEDGELNNANLFIFPGDSRAAGVLRENIWPYDGSPWESGKQLSVQLVGNIMKEVNQSTTPIAISRGLQDGGTWSKDGVWGTDGGFIGFLDGQVRWYKNLTADDGKLSTDNGSTASINAIMTATGGRLLNTNT
jgi:type II secretory pathway pseudopilin PulG